MNFNSEIKEFLKHDDNRIANPFNMNTTIRFYLTK